MSSARRVGDGLRRLRVLAAASPLRISVLAASSLIGALAEAAILVLLVRVGVALAAGDDVVVLHLLGTHRLTIGQLLLIGFALVLPRAGLQVLGAWITARIAADTLVRLRTATYDRYTEATWATQSIEQDGHLQEVLTSHVNQLVNASVVVATGMISLLGFLALLLTAFIVNAAGALLIIASVTLLFVGLRPLARIARRRSNDARRANLGYVHEVSETAALAQEARVFDVGEEQRRRAAARVQSVARAMLQGQFIGRLVPGLYQSIAVIAMLFGLWAIFAIGGTSIASLGASVLLLVRALTYGQGLQSTYHQLNELVPYADSVLDTQHRYEVARFERSGRPLEPIERFAFEDVWFSYVPGRPVLRGISFEAERGVAIGVVGPSGSGKSSLLQVLLRLRPVDEGRYTVNGEDAASYAADSWAEHVAFVPQEPRLMAGSVADNIRFLREGISDAEVEAAARAAQLHDEIMGWADGYATPIGDRGASISGGQRQRLALARALVRRPNLLVLDEPTSALDVHSEALIEETLEGLKGSTTIFVVAHRLSTLGMCDRIMVLRDGLVECFEEPARVLESNEYYREGVTLWQLH